jgi:polysaccharide pyruvyl transferase WcaK-like protein
MANSPVRILVAEFFPSFNKGELAILKGMLKSFEVLGEVEVAVFSAHPEIDRPRYPDSVKILDVGHNLYLQMPLHTRSKAQALWDSFFVGLQHLLFIFLYRILGKKVLKIMDKPVWRMYHECDVIIICPDEVDCVNGSYFKISPLYISLLTKTLGKPVVIYANGTTRSTSVLWIWRLRTKRLWKILAKYILTIVDLITVREEGTLLYFKEISSDQVPIYCTADPAFLLSYAAQERVKEIMLDEKIERNDGPLFGVAMTYDVLSAAFRNKLDTARKYKKAVKKIARLLDKLTEEFNSTIVFVPHSIEHHPHVYRDDRIVAKDIHHLMLNKHMTRLITKEYSAEELKGLMGQLDLLISCRCHAAISALSMCTPTCVITRSLDKRVYNIIGKMMKQEKWIYDVENLDAEELFELVSDLLATSSKIRSDLPSIVNFVKKRALLNGRLLKALVDHRLKIPIPT